MLPVSHTERMPNWEIHLISVHSIGTATSQPHLACNVIKNPKLVILLCCCAAVLSGFFI